METPLDWKFWTRLKKNQFHFRRFWSFTPRPNKSSEAACFSHPLFFQLFWFFFFAPVFYPPLFCHHFFQLFSWFFFTPIFFQLFLSFFTPTFFQLFTTFFDHHFFFYFFEVLFFTPTYYFFHCFCFFLTPVLYSFCRVIFG